MDTLLENFSKEEIARLGKQMPHREITGCADETFFEDMMILVLMDLVSGFILAEQEEEHRDAITWKKVAEKALEGLNVTLVQITGNDE